MRKEKVKELSELKAVRETLGKEGKKVVFTNGCFDLLHIGHIRYLRRARELGDVLIVAINSDSSVRALKGEGRPFYPQKERAEILASLEFVDYVTVFSELNPAKIIEALHPDVLVKGGDWRIEEVVGRDFVESYGGQVVTIPEVKGHSTSELVERIRKGGI